MDTRAHITTVGATVLAVTLATGCGGGGRPIASPPARPPSASPASTSPSASVQSLYEAGQYQAVLANTRAGDATALWFAAQSHARLGQREDAQRLFAQLPAVGAGPTWQVVSDLALALLADDGDAIDRGRTAADAYPTDPFVQFELGLAHTRRNDLAAAAQAFDRCVEASPRFAYAYYGAGLAYERLGRADLMVIRLETFQRLASDAPERPEVDALLRTVRAR